MAVIHQRLEITAIYQSISGPPRNKATGHASPDPQILTAVAEMLLINNSDAFAAPPTIRGTLLWLRRPPCLRFLSV